MYGFSTYIWHRHFSTYATDIFVEFFFSMKKKQKHSAWWEVRNSKFQNKNLPYISHDLLLKVNWGIRKFLKFFSFLKTIICTCTYLFGHNCGILVGYNHSENACKCVSLIVCKIAVIERKIAEERVTLPSKYGEKMLLRRWYILLLSENTKIHSRLHRCVVNWEENSDDVSLMTTARGNEKCNT